MIDYLYHHNANTHRNYPSSAETDVMLAAAREAVADLFNATPGEVVFGNNMTTIAFHVARGLGRAWGPGDEVVVTELDHHGNVAPWKALVRDRGITLRTVPMFPESGTLDWAALERAVGPKTRLVAIGAASNALGTINDVRAAARLAHAHGALCFVDAVHYAAHGIVDVRALECDFLACSSYKFYGPHAGVMFGRGELLASLDIPKLDPAPNEAPDRLETGTQNHEGMVGTGAAVDFLASLSLDPALNTRRARLVHTLSAVHERTHAMIANLWFGLTRIPGVTCYGVRPGDGPRTPTVTFVVRGVSSDHVARHLAGRGIFVSNGDFYATTVIERLGHAADGVVRAGCACYTTEDEIERLVEAVAEVAGGGAPPR
jgi:cysteine desulfurase family protein (TIGR01976 family)